MNPQPKPDTARALRLLLIALIIALMLVLLPSPAIVSYAEVVPLPMDESGGVPPYAWGYEGDSGYTDPSISVSLERGRHEGNNWIAVRISIKDPSQLRTLKAGPYGSSQEARGAALAKRVQSVLAIGGDFFIYHNNGYIVRQGQFYRSRPTGGQDVLIIDNKGDFHVLIRPDAEALASYEAANKGSIVNAFTFGPALIVEGEKTSDGELTRNEKVRAQRIALCQTGELSYLVVYAEGPNDKDSKGLSIPEFRELVAGFPGVITAYNLDGGSSATIVFQEAKINGPLNQRSRSIGDIIYFASAWVEEGRD